MPKTEKVQKVEELKARIEASEALFLADFRGLTVTESGELRRSLSDAGTKFSVVKNTLMRLATTESEASGLEPLLEGPTAVAFVREDPVAAAKSLVDATRKFRTLVLKGAFVEGRVLTPEEAQALATIEPREVLLAKMAGLAKAEMARAAFGFKALQSRFLALLQALGEKLPGEATAEAEPAAEAEAAPEAEPAAEAQAEPEAEAAAEAGPEEPQVQEAETAAAEEPQVQEAAPEADAGEAPEAEAGSEEESAREEESAPEAEVEPSTTDDGDADAAPESSDGESAGEEGA
jgi:large subunit ribosomal protein L10